MSKRENNTRSGGSVADEPAGGVELYRSLVVLSDEFRMRAVAEKDHDAAAIHMALQALVLQAAKAGIHIHMQVLRSDAGTPRELD